MSFTSLLAPALLALAATDAAEAAKNPKNSVLLSNVKTLTLRNGQKTSARRVSPIPQVCLHRQDAVRRADPLPRSSHVSAAMRKAFTKSM